MAYLPLGEDHDADFVLFPNQNGLADSHPRVELQLRSRQMTAKLYFPENTERSRILLLVEDLRLSVGARPVLAKVAP